jgi:hypothetical protein
MSEHEFSAGEVAALDERRMRDRLLQWCVVETEMHKLTEMYLGSRHEIYGELCRIHQQIQQSRRMVLEMEKNHQVEAPGGAT